jgi:hypothetical protein
MEVDVGRQQEEASEKVFTPWLGQHTPSPTHTERASRSSLREERRMVCCCCSFCCRVIVYLTRTSNRPLSQAPRRKTSVGKFSVAMAVGSFFSGGRFLGSLTAILLALSSTAFASKKTVKYEPFTSHNMAHSYNFIIHGDWGWNSINQSLTAFQMGVYGDIIQNKFVVALGDNVSPRSPPRV